MSESATLFAMVGTLYLTVRCAETGMFRFLALAGVLAGWAGTLRVVPLAALLPSICVIYLLPPTTARIEAFGYDIRRDGWFRGCTHLMVLVQVRRTYSDQFNGIASFQSGCQSTKAA